MTCGRFAQEHAAFEYGLVIFIAANFDALAMDLVILERALVQKVLFLMGDDSPEQFFFIGHIQVSSKPDIAPDNAVLESAVQIPLRVIVSRHRFHEFDITL
jgi:hypothetical protein